MINKLKNSVSIQLWIAVLIIIYFLVLSSLYFKHAHTSRELAKANRESIMLNTERLGEINAKLDLLVKDRVERNTKDINKLERIIDGLLLERNTKTSSK